MISDVLFDAVRLIREDYLDNQTFSEVYVGEMRKKIEDLVARMDAVRLELDQPPEEK